MAEIYQVYLVLFKGNIKLMKNVSEIKELDESFILM